MTQYKYDVFISYSRKDYVDETGNELDGNPITKILDAFKENGITYWFDKEGIYSGDQYMEKLADAIIDSSILVFLSSKNSNESSWTAGEIGTAHMYEHKIIPVRIDKTPFARSIIVKIASLDFINFYANEEKGLNDLIGSIKNFKNALEEERKREEEKALQLKREAAKKQTLEEVKELVNIYQRSSQKLKYDIQQIHEKLQGIGITEKKCPICSTKASLQEEYCHTCGWLFSPLYGIEGKDAKSAIDERITIARANWSSIEKSADAINQYNALKEESAKSAAMIAKIEKTYSDEKKALELKIEELSADNEKVKAEYEDKIATLLAEKEELNKALDDSEKENDKKIQDLEKTQKEIETKTENTNAKNWNIKLFDSYCTIEKDDISFNMIKVEGGKFSKGNITSTIKENVVSTFYIGQYVVTQKLWQAITGNEVVAENASFPMINISWEDCKLFIQKLNTLTGYNFRLPTEDEWEFAAKGGSLSTVTKYSGSDNIDSVAWNITNSKNNLQEVGKKNCNELSIYDMSGNVWEWCEDDYYDVWKNRNVPDKKICRGGCYSSAPSFCQVITKNSFNKNYACNTIGFRLALDIK